MNIHEGEITYVISSGFMEDTDSSRDKGRGGGV